MFKRLPRVLFVAGEEDCRLPEVLRLAQGPEFSHWMDVRALATSSVPDASPLQWADVLIVFESGSALIPEARSLAQAGCKLRIWELPVTDDDAWVGAVMDRLQGMVGGLRMLGRTAPVQLSRNATEE